MGVETELSAAAAAYGVVAIGAVASLAAGAATGVGALPIFLMRSVSKRHQNMMLGFGAGVMLAASFFSLLNPAIGAAQELVGAQVRAVGIVVAGFLSGAVVFWAADRMLPHEHFISGREGAGWALRRIWLFVIAITIHNFPEGLSVGVGFGDGDLRGGAVLALGIGLQNMPEGLVVALALLGQGYSRAFAFFIALLTGLVEPVGGLLGVGVVTLASALLPFMLALAAGAMVYVISDEIIPETHRAGHEREATASLMVGFVVMMALDVMLG